MSRAKRTAETAKRHLKTMRETQGAAQERVAAAGELTRSAIAYVDTEGHGLSLATFVGYARGLTQRGAWRVLRDVEESIYGEDRP